MKPEVRTRFLYMPTDEMQRKNMHDVYETYKLNNVIAGVDGCHFPFFGKPHGVPIGRDPLRFLNRKGFYSINEQVVGGYDRRIYDINLRAPGSYHDATTWLLAEPKAWFETRFPQRYVLGDSAYAQSDVLMTPYSEPESRQDDNKCLYNIRHSGSRVEMTENIYGMLKRRFPIVKCLRVDLGNAMNIIICTAILHNMALDFQDDLPNHDHPDYVADPRFEDVQVQVINQVPINQRRLRAQLARYNWRHAMDPNPTEKERKKMARHRVDAAVRQRQRRR